VYGVVEVVGVGVQRRWCCSEASSRFSTHVIGLSSRICGALYEHDEHWFPCPPVYPSFIWRCARVTHCHNNDRRPPIRTRMKIFSYMEDHIPNSMVATMVSFSPEPTQLKHFFLLADWESPQWWQCH
jgi:hypothetical protein